MSVEVRKGDPTGPNSRKSLSLTKGFRAQQSEMLVHFERQHAFEVSLEHMLMEVDNGADWPEEEEKQKKVGKDAKNKEEEPSAGWQKIWDKKLAPRLG